MQRHIGRVVKYGWLPAIALSAVLVSDMDQAVAHADKNIQTILKNLGMAEPPSGVASYVWGHPWAALLVLAVVFVLGAMISWGAEYCWGRFEGGQKTNHGATNDTDGTEAFRKTELAAKRARLRGSAPAATAIPDTGLLIEKAKRWQGELDEFRAFLDAASGNHARESAEFEAEWDDGEKRHYRTSFPVKAPSHSVTPPSFQLIKLTAEIPIFEKLEPILIAGPFDPPHRGMDIYRPEANSTFLAVHRTNLRRKAEWIAALERDFTRSQSGLKSLESGIAKRLATL